MEEKQKIQKIAHGFKIAFKVVRILCIVAAAICLTTAIISFIIGGMKLPSNIYLKYEDVLAGIEVDFDSRFGSFVSYTHNVPLKDIYANGDLENLVFGFGTLCLGGVIESIVLYVILIFFMRVFTRLESTESPFTPETSKDLKVAFILISILVALQSIIFGLVVAGLLTCMYVMFQYGCKLQKNEDETL